MSEHKTISTRFKEWIEAEPLLAYLDLFFFGMVFIGLMVHLGFTHGLARVMGLIVLIVGDVCATGLAALRKQWWWASFYVFITIGVIGWELASYFFGGV